MSAIPPIYITPHATYEDERTLTFKVALHEARFVWMAFEALAAQPCHFDCSHPICNSYPLLETIQRAIKEQYPEQMELFEPLPRATTKRLHPGRERPHPTRPDRPPLWKGVS